MSEVPLNPSSLAFVEGIYEAYLEDPESVDAHWRSFFEHEFSGGNGYRAAPTFKPASIFNPVARPGTPGEAAPSAAGEGNIALQQKVGRMVRNYRVRGHIMAKLDPLGLPAPEAPPELEPSYYDITEGDMSRTLAPDTIPGTGALTVGEIITRLKNTYSRSIGAQFMHIDDLQVRKWLQRRMETTENRLDLSRDEQLRILSKLTDAVSFEEFIQKKYVGVKAFRSRAARV